jgi:hypothetical protein
LKDSGKETLRPAVPLSPERHDGSEQTCEVMEVKSCHRGSLLLYRTILGDSTFERTREPWLKGMTSLTPLDNI